MNATPHETLTGLEILIVEDEALLRKQLTAQLERLGMDVTGTGTLSGARQLVSEMSFDFALLDVNLPDGRGTDLLRESAFSPNTGVVVMTANGEVAGAVEAMRLGALDYLVKPFEPRAAIEAKHARRGASTRGRAWFLFWVGVERSGDPTTTDSRCRCADARTVATGAHPG
jgi:DNA-binding response OmpR family regulator